MSAELYPRDFEVGRSPFFLWGAPQPIDSIAGVTLNVDVGGYSQVMSQAVVDVAIASGGISADRATLTASLAPSIPDSFLPKFGAAFLITAEGDVYTVEVVRVVGTAITLSEPLRNEATLTGSANLQFALWNAPFTAADVTASAIDRGVVWRVAYTLDLPGQVDSDSGLLRVVKTPFQTGLTSHILEDWFPDIGAESQSNDGWDSQIEMELIELRMLVTEQVSERDATFATNGLRVSVNDVESNNPGLRLVHAHLTMASILTRQGSTEQAEYHIIKVFGSATGLTKAPGLFEIAMRPIWVDENRDDVVTDDEVIGVMAPGAAYVSTGFLTTPRVTIDGRQR